MLDDLLARLKVMPEADRKAIKSAANASLRDAPFTPNQGPQMDAYLSSADILLYGGQAGGGKTLLEIGWGVNEAESGIIFRRQRTQTDGLEKEGKKLIGSSARYNGQDLEWTWPTGKTLKLAGMNQADDWMTHAGRERDYMAFDEAGEFLEMQVAQIIAWLRAEPGRRCRVILGSNPPRAVDGRWLRKWFAPWLDPADTNRAEPGELRWACGVTKGDEYSLIWVEGPGEYEIEGERYAAKSYTFIPASLSDNPFRDTPEYRAQLQSLPEPLRSQLLYGDFTAGEQDQAFQAIPTAWIDAAMARWTEDGFKQFAMTAMALDPAGGGRDDAVVCWRHGGWYAPFVKANGPETADGSHTAGMVISHRRDAAPVVVDVGGGYGGAVMLRFKDNGIPYRPFNGANATNAKTVDGQLGFVNDRGKAWWRFREALDPDQEGGSVIALPPDPELRADLAAPTYEVRANGLLIESKENLRKRLGRSPGKGDAAVMCLSEGNAAVRRNFNRLGRAPQVITNRKGRR